MSDQSSSQSSGAQEPVAYDRDGRPLYAAPPSSSDPAASRESRTVYTQRAVAPEKPEEVQSRHDESAKRYPSLDLTDVEYVVDEVRRSMVGLLIPAGLTVFMIALIIAIVISLPTIGGALGLNDSSMVGLIALIGILMVVLLGAGGYVAVWVYMKNRFFLTNESVIQEIQSGLFARRGQKCSLGDIEDVSYRQTGLLQFLFNYGSIRLSTPGDETTYRFNYVENPKEQVAKINDAVASFKSGRPIDV